MACFAQLRDNVPSWISDANQLAVHVHAKRAEFAAETRKLASPPRKSMSSLSTCSQRSSSLRPKSAKHGLKRILSRDSLRESTKRRRVREPAASPPPSTPAPESTSSVILYDGHTQKVLEQMVRQIWSAKSSIRSSRISSSIQSALRGRMRMRTTPKKMDSARSAIEVDDGATGLEDDLPDFRPMLRSTRPKGSPYDFIEGQLDTAQNLCETAAYRFLREGNCLDELEGLVQAYELVLEASTNMAEQMAAEEAAKENTPEPEAEKEDVHEEIIPESKRPHILPDGPDGPDESNAGILEVDERSDTSEVSIDITAFRMTRYGQRTLHPFTLTRGGR
ncbi:hypothetical protein BGW36DRAFT_434082 [Talaromyces proteolyticus]|uniref:Uncharacterized protein n=1 Tax=Talaromyces proteolyticus TaxID=1131652 RepID=A0AAD4KDB1_9EURO|nr:uncharacterized protein BGW36DRAFT_434082 [Talaromyces proteolyticus]KAH8688790.1 hypothetical protein BGW36DRAFT_434082 [Talaromyces proteolyticus]